MKEKSVIMIYLLVKLNVSCFSHVRLFVTLWTVASQTPLSMRTLQARIVEWVAMSSFRGTSRPKFWTRVSCIAGRFFTS